MTGWNHVDFKKERFDFITEASDQVFTTTIFGRRSTPVKIFTHILSPEYSKKLIDQRASEHKELLTTSRVLVSKKTPKHKTVKYYTWKPTAKQIFMYLAYRTRVQALQNKPKESKKNVHPQKAAFIEAINHFSELHKNEKLGIIKVQQLQSIFYLRHDGEDEIDLCDQLQSCLKQIGECAAGDEKLFHFTGNCGWIRSVSSKKEIGIWIYQLVVSLDGGLPFLCYFRSHTELKSLGESVPTYEVMEEWVCVLEKYGSPKTCLASDSYYLTQFYVNMMQNRKCPFVSSTQKCRFKEHVDLVKSDVKKPGDFNAIYNKKDNLFFVFHWDPETAIGKKYCMSNALKYKPSHRQPKYIIPAYDPYKLMFSGCDNFNRAFHD